MMFAEIRNRLTLQYAAVMALFLLTFIVVSYAGVIWALYHEELNDVRSFAEQEAREHFSLLKQKESKLASKEQNDTDDNNRKLFFYVFDAQGQLISAEEPEKILRPKIQNLIQHWTAEDGQGKIEKIYLPARGRKVIIACSTKIYDKNQFLGRVYVGEDITSYYEMLKTLLIVLGVVTVVFLFLAAFISHFLAGRAISPIRQSFLRQREFTADASHELRTPLSILLTSAEAIQTDEDSKLSKFSSQVLDDMKNEIRRMANLISDLLTLARADEGKSNIVKEKFDLVAVSEQVVQSFQTAADGKSIKLEFESAIQPMVYADQERLNQLLIILLDNAIKYTSPGGRVSLILNPLPNANLGVRMIVQDTGLGITEEAQKHIFERFYRVDKARSREAGGTGLGLSIARWIVEAHGGEIKVESGLGAGTSFIVTLPTPNK